MNDTLQHTKVEMMRLLHSILLIVIFNFTTSAQADGFLPEFSGVSLSFLESSNSNYEHDTSALRVHFNSLSWQVKGWDLHWALEPNINWYEHELSNPLYIKEDETDYLDRREKFTEGVDFILAGMEGVIIARKKLSGRGNLELSAGLGIAYLEEESERQAKGFTFTETGRIGYSLNTSMGEFFLGYTIMHVSNAGLKNPNGGYDVSGVTIKIQKTLK